MEKPHHYFIRETQVKRRLPEAVRRFEKAEIVQHIGAANAKNQHARLIFSGARQRRDHVYIDLPVVLSEEGEMRAQAMALDIGLLAVRAGVIDPATWLDEGIFTQDEIRDYLKTRIVSFIAEKKISDSAHGAVVTYCTRKKPENYCSAMEIIFFDDRQQYMKEDIIILPGYEEPRLEAQYNAMALDILKEMGIEAEIQHKNHSVNKVNHRKSKTPLDHVVIPREEPGHSL